MNSYGLCILRNTPVTTPRDDVARVIERGRKFFALSREEKEQYQAPDPFTPGFFMEDGSELLGSETLREALTILRKVPYDKAYAEQFDHKNPAVAEPPGLLPAMGATLEKSDLLLIDLLSALGEAVGGGAEPLGELARDGYHNLRLFHYPTPAWPEGATAPNAVREHCDYSLLTAICGRTQQNLEFFNVVENEWMVATIAENEVCVLVGATLKEILRDKIGLTKHRVKCGPPHAIDSSIACFAVGNTRPFRETLPDFDAGGDDNPFALSLRLFDEEQAREAESRRSDGE